MNDKKDVRTIVEKLVRGCSTSNEIAGIVERFAEQYEKGYRKEKREDLNKFESIALKLDIRAVGGTSWYNMLNVLCDRAVIARYISYFENEIEKGCVLVVDSGVTDFYKVVMDGKTFILAPAA